MSEPGTVFRGGAVFDGHRHLPATAVVVSGGRVEALLPEREVERALRSTDGVEVIEVAGGLVLPGFGDAHAHPVQAGVERLRCDLSDSSTPREYLETVGAWAAAHPETDWVLGGGWAMPAFGQGGPRATDLDAVVGDRPVFLANRDHHGAWVSSAALRLAGVDARTPDPPDGRLERDRDGIPSGTLHEGAMALVQSLLPPLTEAEQDAALLEAQRFLHSFGVTAWQDAILGDYAGAPDAGPTYRRADDRGRLTARVRGCLWWRRDRGLEQVADLLARRTALSGGRLDAGSVKIMADGVAENFTAAMSRCYLDGHGHATDNAGLSFVDAERLREALVRLDGEGFSVHVHAIGDRAVRDALDAVAAARRTRPAAHDVRHTIAHLQVVSPADRARFAELDVVANLQALWAWADEQMVEMTLPYLDEEVAGWQYPFGSLAACGSRLALGSDWPVSSPDPLLAVHVATRRSAPRAERAPGEPAGEPFLPHEALTLTQAFAAATSGSAYVNHLDGPGGTGTLAPGMLADLAVLDADPLAQGGPAPDAVRVRSTWVDGRCVHEA